MSEKINVIESCTQGYADLPEEAKAFIRGYITGKLDERKTLETTNVQKSA